MPVSQSVRSAWLSGDTKNWIVENVSGVEEDGPERNQATLSILPRSPGVFPHKGAYKIGSRQSEFQSPDYCNEPWYLTYEETWESIQTAVEDMRSNTFQQILRDLQSFVSKIKERPLEQFENEIQTALVLTGVNSSDHAIMFQRIQSKLESITKHIAIISSKDSNSIRNIIEESISQLINKKSEEVLIKKSMCHMRNLKLWHQKHCDQNDPLVIVVSDFESSSSEVLRDFILILSSYSSTMKFILIFGVATTLHVLHRSLTYDVTSKLNIQVFSMQKQIDILSYVLENTVFCTNIPFKLTGRAFQLLTDIFLFYDFSVESFLRSYKICMILHFYANNISSLCCHPKKIQSRMSSLTDEDLEEIKKLPSIEKYIKESNCESKDKLLQNDEFKLLNNFHQYMHRFLLALRCLHNLFSSLPNAPMGKQLREYYTKVVCTYDLKESEEYKECFQLLSFLSKTELLSKLNSLITIIGSSEDSIMKRDQANLQDFIKTIEEASLELATTPVDIVSTGEKLSRLQLKEKLLKWSQTQSRSPYKLVQQDVLNFLDHMFSVHLVNPNNIPANEIFCYSDGNLAKQHIRGSLRAAIHTGLNDPQVYLNCECCKLENDDAIPSTLPDRSIIYKLHLESRKLINMYDWLQEGMEASGLQNSAKRSTQNPCKVQGDERSAEIPKEVEREEIGGLSRIRWPFNAGKRLSSLRLSEQRQVTGIAHAKSAANDSFVLPADSIFVHFPASIDLLTLKFNLSSPIATVGIFVECRLKLTARTFVGWFRGQMDGTGGSGVGGEHHPEVRAISNYNCETTNWKERNTISHELHDFLTSVRWCNLYSRRSTGIDVSLSGVSLAETDSPLHSVANMPIVFPDKRSGPSTGFPLLSNASTLASARKDKAQRRTVTLRLWPRCASETCLCECRKVCLLIKLTSQADELLLNWKESEVYLDTMSLVPIDHILPKGITISWILGISQGQYTAATQCPGGTIAKFGDGLRKEAISNGAVTLTDAWGHPKFRVDLSECLSEMAA
ncbi:Origin recognition complex subunit 3 [Eufriesea mexicana]|uniref:Origin recognition complex subunit 3 n=1 Tax=Eufriesea mexicana TaxID=516756 RepID=A0A310SLG7_9HYME|nr:Origin recognition complex subunit 3 [Eufriesea mexicana]